MLSFDLKPANLRFIKPAKTSRGEYLTREVFYLIVTDKESRLSSVGEVAPLHDLSSEYSLEFEPTIRNFVELLNNESLNDLLPLFSHYSSFLFGLESALRSLENNYTPYDTPFARGDEGIPINGLVWMGSIGEMKKGIRDKLKKGFHCIKLKIGAVDFQEELSLIKAIRNEFSKDEIEIRLDANGAFSPIVALDRLSTLAPYDIHSIEQPIPPRQWEDLRGLISSSPIPIALDEELIGIYHINQKQELLNTLQPHYIVLKPTLHGGISGAEEWISLAHKNNIQWWVTSTLESNIGLNALAQWTSTLSTTMPQGLGTGLLFAENTFSPLYLKGDLLYCDPSTLQNAPHPIETIQKFLI